MSVTQSEKALRFQELHQRAGAFLIPIKAHNNHAERK
jgi:hypothetical protein